MDNLGLYFSSIIHYSNGATIPLGGGHDGRRGGAAAAPVAMAAAVRAAAASTAWGLHTIEGGLLP